MPEKTKWKEKCGLVLSHNVPLPNPRTKEQKKLVDVELIWRIQRFRKERQLPPAIYQLD